MLIEEERKELLVVLDRALVETHGERRRTDAPGYREQVTHEETTIRSLLEKVRQLKQK